jgi:magnesium chelatase family protein
VAARRRQLQRAGVSNAQLDNAGVRDHCKANGKNHTFLENTAEQMGLSTRACQRVLKVARTLADLENLDNIGMRQLAEALAYRGFDCGNNQG